MALEIFTTKSMPTRHDPDRNCVTRTTTIRPFGIYTIGNPPANCTIQGTISESGYRRLHPIGGDYAWGLRARAASGCGGGVAAWCRPWLVVAVVSLSVVGCGCFWYRFRGGFVCVWVGPGWGRWFRCPLLVVVAFPRWFRLRLGWSLVGGVCPPTLFFLFCLTYPIGGILGRNTKRPKRNNTTRNHRRGQQS